MQEQSPIKKIFPTIRVFCSFITILIMIWLASHLFIRSCGGPFPQRTRGPLAKQEFYELGILPEWERMLMPRDATTNKTYTEMMIEGKNLPPLEYDYPDFSQATPQIPSATTVPSATPSGGS